jgi:hypothetical protein
VEQAPVAPVELPKPTYEAFKIPDDIKLDDGKVSQFTELLSDLELTGKADHATVQAFGQKAVDFYLNEVKQYGENLTKLYQTTWENQKNTWKQATLADPQLGGNRLDTTISSVKSLIRTHGGTTEQQKEFSDVMESSGLGNHPALIRLLANIAVAYQEGKPLAAPKPIQDSKSKTETLYGKRNN